MIKAKNKIAHVLRFWCTLKDCGVVEKISYPSAMAHVGVACVEPKYELMNLAKPVSGWKAKNTAYKTVVQLNQSQ